MNKFFNSIWIWYLDCFYDTFYDEDDPTIEIEIYDSITNELLKAGFSKDEVDSLIDENSDKCTKYKFISFIALGYYEYYDKTTLYRALDTMHYTDSSLLTDENIDEILKAKSTLNL